MITGQGHRGARLWLGSSISTDMLSWLPSSFNKYNNLNVFKPVTSRWDFKVMEKWKWGKQTILWFIASATAAHRSMKMKTMMKLIPTGQTSANLHLPYSINYLDHYWVLLHVPRGTQTTDPSLGKRISWCLFNSYLSSLIKVSHFCPTITRFLTPVGRPPWRDPHTKASVTL